MFTGIISALGELTTLEPRGGDARLHINAGNLSMADVQLGDSIACNGTCLTAVELTENGFIADVSVETLTLTTTGNLKLGSRINLEKAMQATDRFGGHIVSGHVDGAGFELNIVPHTMVHTIMGDYQVGTKVNLEVDLVARYLERLLLGDKAADSAE